MGTMPPIEATDDRANRFGAAGDRLQAQEYLQMVIEVLIGPKSVSRGISRLV